MRIAIDIRSVGPGMDGVGYYTANLVREMVQAEPNHEYLLLTTRPTDIVPAQYRARVRQLLVPIRLGQTMDEQLHFPEIMRQHAIDVFHGPGFIVPVTKACKTVVTVHDLIYMIHSEFYEAGFRAHMNQWVSASVKTADCVIAVSECTKRDLVARLGVPEQKITVTHEAAGPEFRPLGNMASREVCQKYGIPGEFILAVGLAQPRKNVASLVRAFKTLRDQGFRAYQLVLAGGYSPRECDIPALVRELGMSQDVLIPGYVPRDDLPLLYSAATLFVFPSLYEGFGLPPLEAMACGTAVVCSNTSSLPEVVGEAAVLVDPTDTAAITNALQRCLEDEALRAQLREEGLARASQFTWRRTAEQTLAAYDRLMRKPQLSALDSLVTHSPGQNPAPLACARAGRMPSRIGIVTPWATQCGIAEYSRFLRNALCDCGAEVLILAEMDAAAQGEPGVLPCWQRGRPLNALLRTIETSRVDAVHLQFHEAFFFLINEYLSVLETLARTGVPCFVTFHELHDRIHPAYFTARAPMVAHNNDCRQFLRTRGVKGPIHVIPHGIVTPSAHGGGVAPDTSSLDHRSTRLTPPVTGHPVLMSCGFIFHKKGYDRVIRALPCLVKSYPDLLYRIVGSCGEAGSVSERYRGLLTDMAQELGVREHVQFESEYAELNILQARLGQADAVVFPYTDSTHGASGAAQIALGAGALVVVSDVPFFGDLGRAVFRFRDDGELVDVIQRALSEGEAKSTVRRYAEQLVQERSWPEIARKHLRAYATGVANHENRD